MPFETFLTRFITNNQQTRTVEPENYYNNEDPGMQIVGPVDQRRPRGGLTPARLTRGGGPHRPPPSGGLPFRRVRRRSPYASDPVLS